MGSGCKWESIGLHVEQSMVLSCSRTKTVSHIGVSSLSVSVGKELSEGSWSVCSQTGLVQSCLGLNGNGVTVELDSEWTTCCWCQQEVMGLGHRTAM